MSAHARAPRRCHSRVRRVSRRASRPFGALIVRRATRSASWRESGSSRRFLHAAVQAAGAGQGGTLARGKRDPQAIRGNAADSAGNWASVDNSVKKLLSGSRNRTPDGPSIG
ncbi:protein of unknown function [Burkholderia multivorans]